MMTHGHHGLDVIKVSVKCGLAQSVPDCSAIIHGAPQAGRVLAQSLEQLPVYR